MCPDGRLRISTFACVTSISAYSLLYIFNLNLGVLRDSDSPRTFPEPHVFLLIFYTALYLIEEGELSLRV